MKRLLVCLTVIGLLLSLAVVASAAAPANIRLTWSGSVSTTQTFNWTTDTATSVGKIQYKKSSSSSYTTVTAAAGVVYGNVKLWKHTLSGLSSGTTYNYRIGDGSNWSAYSTFKTASSSPSTFSFLIFGDTSNGDMIYEQWQASVEAAYAQNPTAKFIMNVGDIAEIGNNYDYFAAYLAATQNVMNKIPIMPTIGGDEYVIEEDVMGAPELFLKLFNLPQNGPTGYKGEMYSFDYGYAHITVISDSISDRFPGDPVAQETMLAATASWLQADLAATTKPFKIVVMHEGFYTDHFNRSGCRWRAALGPIIDANKVDLVFNGHNHIMSRTFAMNNKSQMASAAEGTVYFCVPSSNDDTAKDAMSKKIWQSFYFDPQKNGAYLAVEVEDHEIKVTTKLPDGTLVDVFEINKTEPADSTPIVPSGEYADPRMVLFGTLVAGYDLGEDEITGELFIPIKALVGYLNGEFDAATNTFSYEEGDEVLTFTDDMYWDASTKDYIRIEGLATAGFEAYYDEATNLYMIERWRP